ncbi:Crp/Fnr family transcriptional regulator [Benzoatithermus flavus]|uniref:Crp/Fnr family transcriptional regulator n=1 Tax=Benzoatithermus flavus TaxID=3108223 RepID=A0ABU8XVG2_9PROT
MPVASASSMRAAPPEAVLALQKRLGLSGYELGLVRSLPLFAGTTPEQLADLLEDASVRAFPRGTSLFIQGDPAIRFFVVLDGWVRLTRQTPDGNEMTVALFGKGDSIAEAAILQSGRYPVNGQVLEPSRLLVIPSESFLARLRESTELCLNMMAAMARRLHAFLQQLEQVSTRSTTERVALFLLRLARQDSGPCTIELPLDKTFIAARLGMQPETLSRSFAKLRQHGVEVSGGTVTVADMASLRALVAGDAD